MNALLEQLNAEQRAAVLHVNGALLVLAGAGSGKTRVVTYRIAHLLESGIPEYKILGVTFTNKAAAEMKERVHNLTSSHVLICTFHSLGARILRESIHHLGYSRNFTIYDEDDVEKLMKSCLEELNIKDKRMEPKAFRQMISAAKNNVIKPEDTETTKPISAIEEKFPLVYQLYQKKLLQYNAVDFDDLLYLPVILFREHAHVLEAYQARWSHLLIDEYQDTNQSQYEIAKHLVAHSHNICVVGDPDQSIYSWRGANIDNILNFSKDYPGAQTVRLEENYRSHTHILSAANAVIALNQERIPKNLWSNLGPGERIKYYSSDSERDEANFIAERIHYHHGQGIPLNKMVVFYRTHAQSRPFEDIFVNRRIPYIIVGGISFYQRKEIKDILAFLRVVNSNQDFISFQRTINLPKRGIGDSTLEKIQHSATDENMAIFSYCEALVEKKPLQHIVKLSARQFQGLQEYVAIISDLRQIAAATSLTELVKSVITRTQYTDMLREDMETFEDREENINALVAKAAEWEDNAHDASLSNFLEELSLKSSLDETDTQMRDRINLMTIHNGKGLEFPVVFLAGMEEDLFPHANSRDSLKALEEERRLCYVGITRAKDNLYISSCLQRFIWGVTRTQRPSRFVREIPSEHIEKVRRSHAVQRMPAPPPRKVIERSEFIDDMDQTVPGEEESAINFKEGDAVYHKDFGVGVIVNTAEGSLGAMYKIHFSRDNRERTIVAKYAKLKRV